MTTATIETGAPESAHGAPGTLPVNQMSPTPIEKSEAELALLKARLSQHDAEGAAIDRDLAAATARARAARLSMDEIASHAGVTRPTLYSVLRRAKDRAVKSRPGTRRSNAAKR